MGLSARRGLALAALIGLAAYQYRSSTRIIV
jgi:hypothetical protein